MKYEITDDVQDGLRRIRALRDIPRFGVKAGDLGGLVESEVNLSQSGDAWVFGNARVSGNSRVSGDSRVFGNSWVFGNSRVSGHSQVFGNSQVSGDSQVFGNSQVSGDSRVFGNSQVFGNSRVSGDSRVSGNSWVFGNSQVFGDSHSFAIAGPITPHAQDAHMFRLEGGGHHLSVGCWKGTAEELAELADSEDWPSGGDADYRAKWAPSLRALAAYVQAVVATWETQHP